MALNPKHLAQIDSLIQPMEFIDVPKKLNLCLFGDHGSWKTVTACQIGQDQGRVILYTADNDYTSLHNHPEIGKNVTVVHHRGVVQMNLFAELFLDEEETQKRFPGAVTFVWDTVGGWVANFIHETTGKAKFGDNSRTSITARPGIQGATSFINDMDLVMPEYADYNLAKLKLLPILQKLTQSKLNMVFNCHVKSVEAGKSKRTQLAQIRPDMPEECSTLLARKCDGIGLFEKQNNGIPSVSFALRNTVVTKSRLDFLSGKKFQNPTEFVKLANEFLGS